VLRGGIEGLRCADCSIAQRHVHVLRYEALKKCATCELRQVCRFVGLGQCDSRPYGEITRQCDFSTLKNLSNSLDDGKWGEMKKGNPNSNKIRSGKVGSFRNELSSADQEYLQLETSPRRLANKDRASPHQTSKTRCFSSMDMLAG